MGKLPQKSSDIESPKLTLDFNLRVRGHALPIPFGPIKRGTWWLIGLVAAAVLAAWQFR